MTASRPARNRSMFARNSRIPGLIAFSAADISALALAAGPASWSNGNTNRVSGAGGASTGNGRTYDSILKASPPL